MRTMAAALALATVAMVAGCAGQGSAQPSAQPCAEPGAAYLSNAYSPSLSEVAVGANVVLQNPSCFSSATRAAAQAWLDWWHQPVSPACGIGAFACGGYGGRGTPPTFPQ